jgi:hypothetical protein
MFRLKMWWWELQDLWYTITNAWQRVTKGYDQTDVYLVSHHLSTHIPDLLRDLKKITRGYPCGMVGHQALAMKDNDPNLIKWIETIDEIIAGFEAAERLIQREHPAHDELYEEWDKLYPNKPPHYFDETTRRTDGSIEMKTHPEFGELEKELKVIERDAQWEKEQFKIFHRGMYLFHKHFFDLWD